MKHVNMFCKIQNPLAVHTETKNSESIDPPLLYSKPKFDRKTNKSSTKCSDCVSK